MKRSCFKQSQTIAMLRQAEGGRLLPDLYRAHGISATTCYKWRSNYGGMAYLHGEPDEGP